MRVRGEFVWGCGRNPEGAKVEGRRLLEAAGIAVDWIDCPSNCGARFGNGDVILRIVPRSMEGQPNLDHSLGYAMPFIGSPATRAYVLYDCVREKVRKSGVSESRLLGYVMVHEVAHLLLGDERHSQCGVMMSTWPEKELVEIERGMLIFSPDEGRLLQAGAMARAQVPRQQ